MTSDENNTHQNPEIEQRPTRKQRLAQFREEYAPGIEARVDDLVAGGTVDFTTVCVALAELGLWLTVKNERVLATHGPSGSLQLEIDELPKTEVILAAIDQLGLQLGLPSARGANSGYGEDIEILSAAAAWAQIGYGSFPGLPSHVAEMRVLIKAEGDSVLNDLVKDVGGANHDAYNAVPRQPFDPATAFIAALKRRYPNSPLSVALAGPATESPLPTAPNTDSVVSSLEDTTSTVVETQLNAQLPQTENANIAAPWHVPLTITPNNFIHKSLSCWSLNPFVGCSHACRPCYVPDVSTNKMAAYLAKHGVKDPDAEWGSYSLVRPFNEKKFIASLRKAEKTPAPALNADGNRAIMLSTTTDAWQVVRHPDTAEAKRLNEMARNNVRRALELILEHSTLNVRILTRSPLVQRDFDLLQRFGNRVLVGSSIPTLRNDIAKIYEPGAPAPTRRLEMLKKAKDLGIPVYVAMAPTYPECDEADIRATLQAVAEIAPVTIFAEPVNIRANNADRIARHAESLGVTLNTAVFDTTESWADYALDQLRLVERVAQELGLADRLHLWPDKHLGAKKVVKRQPDPAAYQAWLTRCWNRISEWPSPAPTVVEACDTTAGCAPCVPSGPIEVLSDAGPVLTPDEQAYLAPRVNIVRCGLYASVYVAKALVEIHAYQDGRLWKVSHDSFEAFCRQHFRVERSQAYRLLAAGKFLLSLESQSPRGDHGPVSEKQVRPLLKLPTERQVQFWLEMVAETPPNELSSGEVKKRVQAELKKTTPLAVADPGIPATKQGPKPEAPLDPIALALKTAGLLRQQVVAAGVPSEWVASIDGLAAYLTEQVHKCETGAISAADLEEVTP